MSEPLFEVLEGGLLTTVQDGGRRGWAHLGVPPSGACDPLGLAAANLVLDNDGDAAAVEMTLVGPTLRVLREAVVGIGGAELGGRVRETGRLLVAGRSHRLVAGDVVEFPGSTAAGTGARAYLAMPGGVDVAPVLGSRSTCLAGGFGGLDGRPLRAGDRLASVGDPSGVAAGSVWPWAPDPSIEGRPLRVLPGPWPGVAEVAAAGAWRVAAGSDRVGLRLEGGQLPAGIAGEVASHGVSWGAIQVPPDGRPIVLLADHGTTGGYPVVGVVVRADLPRLGQVRPGSTVSFEVVELRTAQAARRELRARLEGARAAIREAAAWDAVAESAGA
jgi:antagonist of KipI